ncbi:PREDICTED: kinesin-like protein KIF21A isoform X1 [Nicrophorus vespilloides]|uniref:Kinesin-like protein KIF21A isoform X1 n=1 Tax=Nicrophorus vespilloides TaxID=110193 RepID=A0ABM1MNY4_NICVS|nr:PREDICTED: kinesin-like protein KIF21A isoform X1 [Nicrophorus vespilloides]XP_017776285.1 PREDICTED: kinesin-like protein KIF21A isoform X1 [Nicrophorus vespilloides]
MLLRPIIGDTENMDEDDVTVRVAVRIRPQIPREKIEMCQICTTVTPGEPQVLLGSDKVFTYDYVFDTPDNQVDVFSTCVAPLIDSSLEGYNATILAYGQTGSGKTYTMGSGFDVEMSPEQVGIIPRAIEHLFEGIQNRIDRAKENGILAPEFKVMAQFMELYNEEVIDLFNPAYNKEKSYKIHEDSYGGIQVKGVALKTVTSTQEALQCLRIGALSRTTASTQMNTQSSRSHAIFTLHIKQQRLVPSDEGDSTEFETLTAKFHFVDLAGSERLKRTGATGDRAKEGISINCGLLALGNVISALGDKSKKALHIPYRDSKLTRLLQDSLGGNSQTVMIACVSPSDSDFMETLNTLKYANRARNIKNKLTINQDKSSRTIGQLRTQIAQLQLELVEYKQGKRMVGNDGTETVNDMFYENNMLQGEVNNLRTRVKAMQDTIDALTLKNTALLAEKSVGNWITSGSDNHLTDMVQEYMKEIEELKAKLIEANNTCEILRKQIVRSQASHSHKATMDVSFGEIPSLIEEAKRELEKEKQILQRNRRVSENEESDISEYESDSEDKDSQTDLKDELMSLTTDIDMKQKLIDELELSQRRMQTMRQHYEDKLMQLQARITNTQEERDKVLNSYSAHPEPSEKVKKVKDEYTRKLSDMQKELKRLQVAQKEHARLVRNQSQQDNQLKSFKNELFEMKRAKVKLINKMKEESQRHKESEMKKIREIAQLRKETRKSATVIKAMETERRIKDQVLKRKQEEVSNLRKSQRSKLSLKASGRLPQKPFVEKHAKQKWLKVEKSINNITISKKNIVEQEVRMEHFLKKREDLGKELEVLQMRREQAADKHMDLSQLDNFIEDIQENINYVQETINETQHNVMQIEESQDNNEAADIQQIVDSVSDIYEAKYLMQKLFSMTLSQSHAVAHRDAKLKENETVLSELQQENTVKGQLLDHVLNSEFPIFAKDLTTSVSSNANDTTSSTYSSRSGSPVDTAFTSAEIIHNNNNNKSKARRRTVRHDELLFGSANV